MPTRDELIQSIWDGVIQTGKTPTHPIHPKKSPMLYLRNTVYQRISEAQRDREAWGEIGQLGATERDYTYSQIATVIGTLRDRIESYEQGNTPSHWNGAHLGERLKNFGISTDSLDLAMKALFPTEDADIEEI